MYRFIKLNEHNEYLKMLDILARTTKSIEYVLVDEDDTGLVDLLQDDIYLQKDVNKWWGTKTGQRCRLFKIKATPKLFSYLKRLSTFCVMKTGDYGDYAETTDFGINDVAFFDDKPEPILFTTTHEGCIALRKDIRY